MVFFMKQHKDLLVQRALEKADEAILSAEASIRDNFLSTAQNRVYYAIFYTVNALGYFYEFSSSKHSQYLSWFNKKFVYTEKVFEEKLFKIYKEAYENRQKSDYEYMWKPIKEDVISDLNEAKIFIGQIKKHLGN